jgi:hypothetical protein
VKVTGSGGSPDPLIGWLWVGSAQLHSGALYGEHPVDARPFSVATLLPADDLGDQRRFVWDAAIKALGPREAVPRGRFRSGGFPRRHRGLWSWNDLRPVASGRGKDAVEANGMFAGARDERQESLDELERGEHDRLGPVGKRALEPQGDTPVSERGQPAVGDGRPREVAGEVLEAVRVVGRDAHVGVEVEPLDGGAPAAGDGCLEGVCGPETQKSRRPPRSGGRYSSATALQTLQVAPTFFVQPSTFVL